MKNSIKLYWWKHKDYTNFGDELNKYIVEYLSKKQVIYTEKIYKSELLGIGSILPITQQKSRFFRFKKYIVWGSGTLSPYKFKRQNLFDIKLLRGPLTHSLLTDHLDKDIPYGDPGLLCDKVWPIKKEKIYKWGLILHHSQYENKKLLDLLNTESCLFIDLKNPDLKFIMQQINSCENIASTSLHGLIVADSYNIPNYWIWAGDIEKSGEWKFWDYYLGINKKNLNYIPLENLTSLNEIENTKDFSYFSNLEMIKQNIIKTFPI